MFNLLKRLLQIIEGDIADYKDISFIDFFEKDDDNENEDNEVHS